ncbi:beta-N-acetylhexosaminidase [Alistipes intestinihominis]|uniref:beta-N-acetylhexosaminidase n=1 Tax=Alistipes intestinihominis TaxID=3133172 RepID=A0ABV1GVI3_9BACT
MKLRFPLLLAALLWGLLFASAQPAPKKTTPRAGHFTFGPGTTVAADSGLQPLARYAAEYLGCEVRNGVAGNGAVVLTLDAADGGNPEAYRLDITPEYIRIGGSTYGGVFNGVQQLFRLLPPEIYARKGVAAGTQVACTEIEDEPRFAYRGMMLDVARTWIDKAKMKRYIDLFSYHNINKLHLHLSDDEGWRIEIKSHPELTEIGGFRGGDSPVRPVYGKWSEKYGGYFTQEEMRGLIRYAAERNIEIIPEIDLPGHSRNIASVHPEIRCNYPPDTVSTNGYDYRSAWCVAREANYALLEDILGELCELFPSEYIHVGGDEVEMTQWTRCPDCRTLMARLGTDDPRRLQDLFMERTAAILAAHGKRPAVWNEAVRTGAFTKACRVHGWESVKACLDATAKGYRTVVMPGEYFYFDMRQTPREDGHDWAAIFDAKKVYGFDFSGFTPEQMRRVEGLQGAFFSEAYVSHEPEKPDYLDYMLFPRVCALARIAWSGNGEGWDAYYKELKREHYDRMAAMGIRFRLFPPRLSYKEGAFTASADDCSEIFYLTDGSAEEHPYTGPVRTAQPHRYRFFTRYKTARSPYAADKSYWRTVTPAVAITTSMSESEKFPYSNAEGYRGLSRTRRACRQQDWILYTFEQPVKCREMYLQTGNRQLPKTIVTTGYAEISYDGTRFEPAGELLMGSIVLHPERAVKAVRIVSTCDDNGTPYVTIQPPVVKPRL